MKQRTSQLTALDTNVLERYYVQAEQTDAATALQCEHARALLESGKPLFVATTVALELEWVLHGLYKLEAARGAEHLASVWSDKAHAEHRVAHEMFGSHEPGWSDVEALQKALKKLQAKSRKAGGSVK